VDALPVEARDISRRGLAKVVDYQDLAYGEHYLAELEAAANADRRHGGEAQGHGLTVALAKHLANALCYDDVIRVADLKTRGTRFARVRADVAAGEETIVQITEFMHPRAEEVCGLLPARIGRWVEGNRTANRVIDRLFNRGRRVRTDTPLPFLMLYGLAGLRRFRRRLLRDEREAAHRRAWLSEIHRVLEMDYGLAVELVLNRRLIKGYSDTHSRGLSKFDRVMEGARLLEGRSDAADWARRLREAALLDAKGQELDGALATIRSFIEPQGKKED
jgi:indolepyruvate ferredoxin oxidoreductase, beta subunit